MKVNLFVHRTNRSVLEKILSMKDTDGKGLISATQTQILMEIARFPHEDGNYMSLPRILESMPGKKMQLRSLKRHMAYFVHIGIVSQRMNGDRLVRRLEAPVKMVAKSLRDFRSDSGMKEYQYVTNPSENKPLQPDELITFETLFFDEKDAKFANEPSKICPKQGDIFAGEYLNITTETKNMDKNNTHPPDTPSKHTEKIKDRSEDHSLLPKESNPKRTIESIEPHEPLMTGKKRKSLKTAKERKAEAIQQWNNGHIVNPNGKVETRGRRLSAARARAIGETGAVSIPQLWAAYLQIFKAAFGSDDILYDCFGRRHDVSRENVTKFFDSMRQNLQDVSGYVADNRDLYNYLVWFHDTQRLTGLMKSLQKAYVPPEQLKGKVFLRRYYDFELKLKGRQETAFATETIEKHKEITEFIRKAYDSINLAIDSKAPSEIVSCLVSYGYIIVAEFLHDYKHYGQSESKKYIIDIMAKFLASSTNKEATIQYMSRIMETTKRNKEIESSLWVDWEGACSEFLPIAIEQSNKMEN